MEGNPIIWGPPNRTYKFEIVGGQNRILNLEQMGGPTTPTSPLVPSCSDNYVLLHFVHKIIDVAIASALSFIIISQL